MLIVFEGPDGAGKTTLMEEVGARLRYEKPWRKVVAFQNPPIPDGQRSTYPFAHITQVEYNALRHFDYSTFDLLKDRAWATDVVYSKVYRRDAFDRSYINPWADFGERVLQVHVNVRDWKTLADRRKISVTDPAYDFIEGLRDGMIEYFKDLRQGGRHWTPSVTLYSDVASKHHLADIVMGFIADESWMGRR
jgi:hypothetical protein